MDSAPPSAPAPAVRIDKWLWAVRLFKTRSLASEACRGGHVSIGGATVKPSREVRPGDVISVLIGEIRRTVQVLAPIEKRVGPKLVGEFMLDLTPAEEYLRVIRSKEDLSVPQRPKGAGRPTKKDRRSLSRFEEQDQ